MAISFGGRAILLKKVSDEFETFIAPLSFTARLAVYLVYSVD